MHAFQVPGVPARLLSSLLSLALVLPAVLVMGVVVAPPAAAAAQLTLAKQAPASVLAGEEVTYTLTARNPGDAPLYNVSFRDVLPEVSASSRGARTPGSSANPHPRP